MSAFFVENCKRLVGSVADTEYGLPRCQPWDSGAKIVRRDWQKLDATGLKSLQARLGLRSLFAAAVEVPVAVVGCPSQKMETISNTNSHPYRLRQ